MSLFGSKAAGGAAQSGARMSRHSSGWSQLLKHMNASESLRVLDVGPTSAANINFITGLGHSIYMADMVEDAARFAALPRTGASGEDDEFNARRFVEQNLDFAGRVFDVVTFWDTADYLPAAALQPVVDRLYEVMSPGAQLLAFFHSKSAGDPAPFSRYHLTAGESVEMQRASQHPLLNTYTNRQVEAVFQRFSAYKFFLAKDALREVIVTR